MIPDNNISVLPWYSNLAQQNARRWWIYDRVYPLFTPEGYIPPFQLTREARTEFVPGPGEAITETNLEDESVLIVDGGDMGVQLTNDPLDNPDDQQAASYDVTGLSGIYIKGITLCANPGTEEGERQICYAYDASNNIIGYKLAPSEFDWQEEVSTNIWNVYWRLPAGTVKVWVQVRDNYNYTQPSAATVHQVVDEGTDPLPISLMELYSKDGEFVKDLLGDVTDMYIQNLDDVDVIIGLGQDGGSFNGIGQFYVKMSDGVDTWYSEVFTAVNDIDDFLKVEWWDESNFVMDAGTIVYEEDDYGRSYRNILYLASDIAKPEYIFEEEGETRDGTFFPTKQISQKRYRFAFFASEYLLDVMRFIRMADHLQITYKGKVYVPNSFLITPEWEENGDVAGVTAEFECATVAKKIATFLV